MKKYVLVGVALRAFTCFKIKEENKSNAFKINLGDIKRISNNKFLLKEMIDLDEAICQINQPFILSG
ncbi:MAG: hypothetical protein Q8880_10135 [Bacteroidota bacterium]|nr:hypothetical protein [Bacteroidota bacterium]